MTQLNKKSVIILVCGLLFSGIGLAGCEEEGPAERAGEKIDSSVEKAGEKIEEAGEKIEEKAN